MKRSLAAITILFWAGIGIAVFYVVQKPDFQVFAGLVDTALTLLVSALLLFNAYTIGGRCLQWTGWDSNDSAMRLILGTGIGLGCLGILGLFFSAIQLSHTWILVLVQLILATVFLISGDYQKLKNEGKDLVQNINLYLNQAGPFTKIAVFLPFLFSFALALTPQFEAFDALFYHLTQPTRILQDGGLRIVNIPHFWFPNITENLYLWGLAFNAERSAQILHFTWGLLSALLLLFWAARTWNNKTGHKTLLLLATMPSLPLLASWAYADMALSFYTIAALYLFTQYKVTRADHSLYLLGIVCGLAMGVKYTSFVLPLTCGLLLLFERPIVKSIQAAARFSVAAILTALPWYLRNAVMMNNPFYPFAFGGRYWDSFLAKWYSAAGTGIGWDLLQIIRLPLDATLGYRDANYSDGRIGPVFLVLLPVTLWIILTAPRRDKAQTWSLVSISLFTALSYATWTFGVINSSALWQTRLLFPALLPFAIPTALAWQAIEKLDTSRLRVSFLVNSLIGIVVALAIFDVGTFVLRRNPLAVAFGAQSREGYIERVNPPYAALMQVMNELPTDANLYSLFEPRSYDLPRPIQPDPIVANFAHDLYLYKSPTEMIDQWRDQGYTHILVYEAGMQFMLDNNSDYQSTSLQNALEETINSLQLVSQTPDGVYTIYAIP